MEGYVAKELATGVTFYEKVEESESTDPKAPLEEQMLELEQKANSIVHLIRSNEELQAACEEEFDQDFADAIEENKAVIAKQKNEFLTARETIFSDYRVSVPLPDWAQDFSDGVFI